MECKLCGFKTAGQDLDSKGNCKDKSGCVRRLAIKNEST